ncbi:MAG: hypothetical protein M1834_007853 [Cirrosporium novae-zelandiae]|nr:MAG: hypothetical protein M1834_007853 [Cirrosporium novae-zelandiae]
MDSYDLIITNGIVVTSSDIANYDIAIKYGKIALLAPSGSLAKAKTKKIIDAEGGYVMPGGVDCHVHLQEPSLFGKGKTADTYESGSRSAIAGGTTTIVTFAPQEKSDTSLLSALKATHAKASGTCYSDYSFHLLISNPTPKALSEFPTLREEGISSLKIYMTYDALQLRDNQILDVLLAARKNNITTMIHAENGDVLNWMTAQLESRNLFAPKYHVTSRPPLLEAEATHRAITLSTLIQTPILLVHVSAPDAASYIRDAQTKGLPILAETCPQYLFLTRSDLAKPGFEGAKCVCSPPPRDGPADHAAIWRGLKNNTFAILSSDHCPFLYSDANVGKKSSISPEYPEGRFKLIPNGCPGVETRLPLCFPDPSNSGPENKNPLTLTEFVALTSTNPSKLYGLYPTKGALIPGVSDADLTIWYPSSQNFTITSNILHHDVDYTPFEGRRVTNWPRYTVLRGKVVWDREGGGIVGEKGWGRFVKREECCLEVGMGRAEGEWDASAF